MGRSPWYRPGNYSLPKWWTGGVCIRVGYKPTFEDQEYFYNSRFMKEIIGHKGGMTQLPKI